MAEAVVLECIRGSGTNGTSAETLFHVVVAAAIEAGTDVPRPEEAEQCSSILPIELRRVLHLPWTLRQCFVLRILVGWPRERCARMLHREGREIDRDACAAAQALARMVEHEIVA